MAFDGILGHEATIAGLTAAHERDRVSHAYLFAGPEGVGKERVALAFLKLVCANDEEPARRDRVRRAFDAGNHPDLLRLEPDGQFIKIDQVREVTKMLRFPPVEAASRAVVIDRAEAMNEAAANSLLKTLEEPNARNIFILISAQPNALLPTIRSRCQQVRFTALPRPVVADWLTRVKGLDAETADEVAGLSAGSLGAAEALIDAQLGALREEWLGALSRLPKATPSDLLDLAETMSADKKAMPAVLDVLRIGMRDLMLRAAGVPEEQLTFRRRMTAFPPVSRRSALASLGYIDEAEESLARNVNPRMIAEHLLLGVRRSLLS